MESEEDDIVDIESLVVELLDEEEEDELDRLLSLLRDRDRFRLEPLPVLDELKRMQLICQEDFFICQYPHPFRDDLCFFDDRLFFESEVPCDCAFNGRVGPYSNFRVDSFFFSFAQIRFSSEIFHEYLYLRSKTFQSSLCFTIIRFISQCFF